MVKRGLYTGGAQLEVEDIMFILILFYGILNSHYVFFNWLWKYNN